MRVATVFYDIDPEFGGGRTFGKTIFDALPAAEDDCAHEFVRYAVWSGRHPPVGVRRIPAGRRHRYERALLRAARAGQDFLGFPRLGWQTWFDRAMVEDQIDLVWFTTSLAQPCELPFIFTVLDLQHLEQPWFPEVSRGGEWGRRQAYYNHYVPRATRVIVANTVAADQVRRHFGLSADRLLQIPHPTPAVDAGTGGVARNIWREAIDRPYLFYPAQFWSHKNHIGALDVVAELGILGHDYDLVLAGADRGQMQRIRNLADERGLAQKVHFCGFLSDADLFDLYRHAHALLFLSHFGPENLPPLEAFALGCPVIAADVPGTREQLSDAAVLVSPLDPREAAARVLELTNESVRTPLIKRGRAHAQRTNAGHYVERVISFLDEFELIRRLWE
jgi:glycosyltransferase involved in cell wall biosynthesis